MQKALPRCRERSEEVVRIRKRYFDSGRRQCCDQGSQALAPVVVGGRWNSGDRRDGEFVETIFDEDWIEDWGVQLCQILSFAKRGVAGKPSALPNAGLRAGGSPPSIRCVLRLRESAPPSPPPQPFELVTCAAETGYGRPANGYTHTLHFSLTNGLGYARLMLV